MIRRPIAAATRRSSTSPVLLVCLLLLSSPRVARAFGPLPPSFWHPTPSSSIDPVATEVKHARTPSFPPPTQDPRSIAALPVSRPSTVKDVLALDFDGVLCHSVDESSRAAFRSVKRLWPQLATYCTVGGTRGNECPAWLGDRCVDAAGRGNAWIAEAHSIICVREWCR